MSEPNSPPTLLAEALAAILKPIVKEALQEALNSHKTEDRLLSVEETSGLLEVSPEWLYHNHKKLPFSIKLGPKMLRFSYQGIQRFLATRRS